MAALDNCLPRVVAALAATSVAILPWSAHAQTHGTTCSRETSCGGGGRGASEGDVVGARLRLLRALADDRRADESHARQLFDGEMPAGVDSDGAEVSIRLAGDTDLESLLDSHGGRVLDAFSERLRYARLPWSAVEPVADHPAVRRIESTWAPLGAHPVETTSRETGITATRRDPGLGVDGEGLVIGDVDAGFDIYHPHLFRADGGTYRWIDVDDDGEFDPGTDGVDLDGNGSVGPNEQLRILDGGGPNASGGDGLTPSEDWVYVDADGDRRRNAGPAGGFDEDDPAYAEPTFVVDDVDEDGQLDPRERLVRLDTSKFRLVTDGDDAYRRGRNLAEVSKSGGGAQSFHGTGVASILVGGQPRYHDRIGLAPRAELVGYVLDGEATSEVGNFRRHRRYVEDAVERDVDVLLHEWSNLFATPYDGSSNLEQALDAARSEGVHQVVPLGNLNLAQKHVERRLQPDRATRLAFEVDEGYDAGDRRRPYRRVWGSLYWRSDETLDVELDPPDGPAIDLARGNEEQRSTGPYRIVSSTSRSPRGTGHLLFAVWTKRDDETLGQGEWGLRVTDVDRQGELTGRIVDRHSSWDVGIHWAEPTRDEGTAVFPATADSAIGIGAYGGRRDQPDDGPDGSEVGELRNYSGRGPRIDGERLADLAAPDDPVAAASTSSEVPFRRFGGTSGAAPHVAAAVGLLQKLRPNRSEDAIETTLFEGARTDDLEPDLGSVPNRGWGWGKLDLYRALRGEAPPEAGTPPDAELRAEVTDGRLVLDASDSTDPDGDSLAFRFDRDYDGDWETDWRENARWTTSIDDAAGNFVARVDVRDPEGNYGGALAPYRIGGSDAGDAADATTSDTAETKRDPAPSPPPPRGCGACSPTGSPAPTPALFLLFASGTLLLVRRRLPPDSRTSA